MNKPFSQACENNRAPIGDILVRLLSNRESVLELGSGTGQHAVWFARQLPHLYWQTSDRIENHSGINQWLDESGLDNIGVPIALHVSGDVWPKKKFEAAFSSNTAHIMAWPEVEIMFREVASSLVAGGLFCLYGPMQYSGVIAAESNRAFNYRLKESNPHQGIREFNDLDQLALSAGMSLLEDNAMPANNRLLVWQKT
ncbi:MAG: cyclopropane fatty-acyl-phospholipid synthase-like methyltransferase [Porticoccaceae bacterium]|jgi:cyclopropane fatty-acyl-phospholipid synthase-like methyltransferase